MEKEQVKDEYILYQKYYEALQKEILDLLYNILDDNKYGNIDVAEIKQRPKGNIKSLESIFKNIDRLDKYQHHDSLLDIKDIAGVRVICHCEDDLAAFAEVVENQLNAKRYIDIKRENKGGNDSGSVNQKSRLSYRAIHINCAKKSKHEGKEIKVYCEIQW